MEFIVVENYARMNTDECSTCTSILTTWISDENESKM